MNGEVLNKSARERDRTARLRDLPINGLTATDTDPRPLETMTRLSALQRIRRIQELRLSREELFGPHLFSDPAWDILLDLYASELEGRRLAVSSVCANPTVSVTTALRWMRRLESQDLVARKADLNDARRTFVSLTQDGIRAMEKFLAQID